jgi:SMI1/KNR4 family protein SUKH-1
MRTIIMDHRLGEPLSSMEIATLEKQLSVSLPLDYAAFLCVHNGGSPQPNVFPISGFPLDTQGILAYFFGVKERESMDLLDNVLSSRNRVPPELLPIGYDVFGNLVCLAVAGTNRGKVYWWFHEEEADEGEPPTYDNLYFVADSFNDLLNSLTVFPEYEGE